MIDLVGHLLVFTVLGIVFLMLPLIAGWFVRPNQPTAEKLSAYECGEPTIGSSYIQFDLRFYVVALLFIIFDVEVALFFPWATVFGKATELTDPALVTVTADGGLTPAATGVMRELGIKSPTAPATDVLRESMADKIAWAGARTAAVGRPEPTPAQALGEWSVTDAAGKLARTALVDMAFFYAILLVGFAYVWYRGDLDWVRAVSAERAAAPSSRAA